MGPLLLGISRLPEGERMLAARPGPGRVIGSLVQVPAFMGAAPTG